MIEVFLLAKDRGTLITGLLSVRLPNGAYVFSYIEDDNKIIGTPGVLIDEIGALVKREMILGRHGVIEAPAEIAPGYHANVMITGEVEQVLTAGLPQHDADGELLPLFQRTHLYRMIPNMAESHVSLAGEPEGYVGSIGVKMFDPALVTNRRREWFFTE